MSDIACCFFELSRQRSVDPCGHCEPLRDGTRCNSLKVPFSPTRRKSKTKLTTLALAGVIAFATSAAFAQAPKDTSGNASMTNPSTPTGAKVDKNGDSKPVDQTNAGKPMQSGSSMKPADKTTGSGSSDPETRLDSTQKSKEKTQ